MIIGRGRLKIFFILLLVMTLLYSTAVAKDVKSKLGRPVGVETIGKIPSSDNQSITINNGVILIDFGENWSGFDVWYYRGGSNAYYEEPYFSYGSYDPVGLSNGTVYTSYPAIGYPNTWYNAIIGLDLDGDNIEDINVTRSIMVPINTKYFLVRYCIENIGESLDNFRVFQGVDYDAGNAGVGDEGGYDSSGDFVWTHDLDDGLGTYVGFKGSLPSTHHDVDYYYSMWKDTANGTLNDANYYVGDVGVALEWNLGTLNSGEMKCLTVKFAFADDYHELKSILVSQVPVFSSLGLLALIGAFVGVAILSIRKS